MAQKHVINASYPVIGSAGFETCLVPSSSPPERDQMTKLDQLRSDNISVIDLEGNTRQNLEVLKTKADLKPRLSKLSKYKMRNQVDFPDKAGEHSPDTGPPGHHLRGRSSTNSLSNNILLPVLGLCAPNANQMEVSERNIPKSHSKQSRQVSRTGLPFDLASSRETLNETDGKFHDHAPEKCKFPSTSLGAVQRGPKMNRPDTYMQVCPDFFLSLQKISLLNFPKEYSISSDGTCTLRGCQNLINHHKKQSSIFSLIDIIFGNFYQ